MNVPASKRDVIRAKLSQFGALGVLLLLGGLALVGPYGVLAWGEGISQLEQRHKQIALLTAERDELTNRVALLDPNHVDPDMASELVRKDLNVARPDEYVIQLDQMR
ncbi:MAG: septum formation initiator family protein [Croceibacterium sp.]